MTTVGARLESADMVFSCNGADQYDVRKMMGIPGHQFK
jgi:hypothetical protein